MSASPTEIWAVTMVRDELDVIEYTLRHMASEGVDGIIVADNLSVDGTWEMLNELKLDCELIVQRDEIVGYYQAEKMTHLAHQAFLRDARWVIPFDADELWYNTEPISVGDALRDWEPDFTDCICTPLFNYYGMPDDDLADDIPFTRLCHRDPTPAPLPKVIIRSRPDQRIDQGNHNARGDEPYYRHDSRFEIGHFPWRSADQFLRKVRNGSEAYRASNLPEGMGAHWRMYGDMLDRGGPDAVAEHYFKYFYDPDIELEYRPVPYRRFDL